MARGRFRWRTRLRICLPWFLVERGVARKGRTDCGDHDWCDVDGVIEHCYHCDVGVRSYDPRHFVDGSRAC